MDVKSHKNGEPKVTPMGNIPGDTDGNFVSEDGKSTRGFVGDTVGKYKSDTDGK